MKMPAKNANTKPDRLSGTALKERYHQLEGAWELSGEDQLQKEFKFRDFRAALQFTNQVGGIAEALDHHPDIYLTYGKVRLQISTHSAGGLTDADFKLAAKVNELHPAAPGDKDKNNA